MRERIVIVGFLALSGTACIVEAPGLGDNREERPAPAGTTVTEVPPLSVQSGAVLDDKVEIIGTKVEPGRARPGDRVKVTTYYKVLEDVTQDYLIFVHVEDVDGRVQRMNYDHPPAGGNYPTTRWKKGDTVQDSFEVQVPAEATLRGLNVWLGFWHAPSDTRMQLKNPDKVRNDGSNRILVTTIPISG